MPEGHFDDVASWGNVDGDAFGYHSSGEKFIVAASSRFQDSSRPDCLSHLDEQVQAPQDFYFRVDNACIAGIGRPDLTIIPRRHWGSSLHDIPHEEFTVRFVKRLLVNKQNTSGDDPQQ